MSLPTFLTSALSHFRRSLTRADLYVPRLLAILSGILLVLCIPFADQGYLAWVALIPLFLATRNLGLRDAFGVGWLGGFTFFLGGFYWLWHVTPQGYLLCSAYLAVYFGLWGLAASAANRRIGSGSTADNFSLMLLLSSAWVAFEWLRGWVFTGFPWNYLGVSQHANSGLAIGVAQIAEFTGVFGISFIICFFNLALLLTIERFIRERGFGRRPHAEIIAAIMMVVGAWNFGVRTAMQYRPGGESLTIALIQPNIPQEVKELSIEKEKAAAAEKAEGDLCRQRLRELTDKAIANTNNPPQLILWPETATPGFFRWDKESFEIISDIIKRSHAYVLTGSMDATGWGEGETRHDYNAAFLVRPDLTIQKPYWKMHLVPFGEYIPLERWLPFMKYLTPIPGSFDNGKEHVVQYMAKPPMSIAPLICFEDTVSEIPRAFAQRGVNLLVNITNDAWFKTSAAAYQHTANAIFRAIETRTPLVRCANSGLSGYIDELGRIVSTIHGDAGEGIFVQGVKTLTIKVQPPGSRPLTFYARYGDVLALACLALTILWCAGELIAGYVARTNRTHESNSDPR